MSIMSHNEKIHIIQIAAAGSGIPSIIRFFSVAASGLPGEIGKFQCRAAESFAFFSWR
jgi:hypothetical protein